MADKGSDSGEEEDPTIAEDVVVTKYKMAGDMANRILKKIIDATTVGTTARTLCQMGDNLIEEETSKVFKKEKELKKGIAFPTCISVNHVVCHFSPLLSETDIPINDGDMVKIDLGVHIDGYIAVVGHTIVVGASKNYTVTDQIQKVAEAFQCKPVEGMLSHQLKRNIIDGEKAIIQNPNEQQSGLMVSALDYRSKVDILISTGDGKTKEKDTRTTVYKRTENNYQLKMKASRAFYSEVCNKFTTMPFTLRYYRMFCFCDYHLIDARAFEDEKKAKMGVVECCKHQLLEPFNVLWEKEGEYVAQFKFTLLIMPNGPIRITQGPFDPEVIQSEYSIKDQEIKASTKASDAVVAETKNGGDAGD
ncbi:hypothetical protein pdam_00000709 [Pocillopora damicornis]|uniref:Peptidase M24 domain-containing protein n=1 Tax=Pocillopora damicornis TaxID=46731 RepID=A0A3M6TY39_POCDA|nr:hypothetical protein pdam_00000709 [Pocillopora damicornis]